MTSRGSRRTLPGLTEGAGLDSRGGCRERRGCRRGAFAGAIVFLGCWLAGPGLGATAAIPFETPHFRYVISERGQNVAFVDRATGTDYLKAAPLTACGSVRVAGKEYPATSAAYQDGQLTLGFAEVRREVVLGVETRATSVVFTVRSVAGGELDAVTYLNVPLTLQGHPAEPFGACALALNLITRVDALPALQSHLRAGCEAKFGLLGAKVAVVAAPLPGLLPALRTTLEDRSELPVCRVAGPWARDVPFNRGSYLFNFGTLTEVNVSEWIEMAHSLGFTQIDNHGGGGFFRFGDFELDRKKWPGGWETWRRIVARLHEAKVDSIFHTYAFFIDKRSKYVTPVPDARLDAFRTFTLAEAVGPDATEIPVQQSTAGLSTVTGFFEHNSVLLHLGDELVTFGDVSREPPWRFLKVQRGAHGTQAAAHAAGARARHLKECFGLLVPNPESSLFEEIAANHADIVNRCGFDGIYLDAIDGSSILRGGDECWYWANKFVVEIQKRLQRPVGMEMSAMWHHFWQYRTRWQAWDYPQRGHTRFVDLHAEAVNGGLLLPLHLGWWGFQAFNPPQVEPTYPEVMETLGARLIGWDAGISLTAGVNREALRNTPLFRRAVEILRTCEEARHAGSFGEAARAKLRTPGTEFALVRDSAGRPRFRERQSVAHVAAMSEPWTLSWVATNRFAAQPARFRLEALMSARLPETNGAVGLADLAEAAPGNWKPSSAEGVTFALRAVAGGTAVTANNAGRVPRNGAWVRWRREFAPPRDLKAHQGLSVELEGDGSGALVGIRLESPHHLAFGAVADRYVHLDFSGRRRFTLVETESSRWSDYVWNDGKSLYNVYRETVDFGAVESVTVWLQHVPPGRPTQCVIGPIQAVALAPAVVRNPSVTVDGTTLVFPVDLPSGSWIEANGPDDCRVYGSKGEELGQIRPVGDWPRCGLGAGAWQFASEPSGEVPARARITLFTQGEEL